MMPRELLQITTSEWGLHLSAAQLDQFEQYAAELARWNARTNLTSITETRAIVIRHFLDALTLALAWPEGTPSSLADIGTGAGFPGLPLKLLWPDLRLLLVESVGKKAEFLAHIVHTLGLAEVEISMARAEEIGQRAQYREQFALTTGRAVARLQVLAEYCLPLCRIDGRFIAPKSADSSPELEAAQGAIQTLGGRYEQTLAVQLPETEPRALIVVRKVLPTPPQYPRRVGIPLKRPL